MWKPEVGPEVLYKLLMDGGGDRAWRRGMGGTGRDKNETVAEYVWIGGAMLRDEAMRSTHRSAPESPSMFWGSLTLS